MKITLKQLAYFRALAQARSFRAAANLANVSQPALSMQIRDLEAILGTALVERGPREVRLTRDGRAVLERADRVLKEAMELEADARLGSSTTALNVGMIPTVAPYLLPGTLAALRATDITRDLRLREAQTTQLLEALRDGRLDAIVLADPPDMPDLIASPLFEDRFVLAGSNARLSKFAKDPEALRPVTLPPEQLLLLDEGHCLADQAIELCAIDRRQTRLDLGAASLSTLCGLVGEGFGLTFLPEIALDAEARGTPTLSFLRFAMPEPGRRIALIRRASTGAATWFDELTGHLANAGADLLTRAQARCPRS
jgi:LysR family hydrogen peroxide-inducible transcriptional activator